jgi:hypothetical protein
MGTASLKSTYLVISGACAVAGVLLGAIQTFGIMPANSVQPATEPAEKVETVPPQPAANQVTVAKLDPAAEATPAPLKFSRGARDGVLDRYPLADLFDGSPASFIETAPGEHELDFVAEFSGVQAMSVTGLEYRHPAAADAESMALQIDMIVLPEGELEGGGREVRSFTIAPQKGPQLFTIPASRGKGVWLRIAGAETAADLIVGDLRLVTKP